MGGVLQSFGHMGGAQFPLRAQLALSAIMSMCRGLETRLGEAGLVNMGGAGPCKARHGWG